MSRLDNLIQDTPKDVCDYLAARTEYHKLDDALKCHTRCAQCHAAILFSDLGEMLDV